MELVFPSPLGPVQQMVKAVPFSPEQLSEQMAQFRHAERHLAAKSFFSLCPQYGQQRVGQHGERGVPVPAYGVDSHASPTCTSASSSLRKIVGSRS